MKRAFAAPNAKCHLGYSRNEHDKAVVNRTRKPGGERKWDGQPIGHSYHDIADSRAPREVRFAMCRTCIDDCHTDPSLQAEYQGRWRAQCSDMSKQIEVDFYFDVSCRWAWWTSIWLRRVARQEPITVTWKVFSLAVQDNPDNYREPPARPHHVRDVDIHRAMLAARQTGGNTAVERLYRAYGNALHAEKADLREPDIQTRCLTEAGLPQTLFDDAQHDPGTEAGLVAETRAALDAGVLGTPSLSLTGSDACLLGPVLGQVPSDTEALELWRSVQFALEHPYVYELKRNRDNGTPDALRAD